MSQLPYINRAFQLATLAGNRCSPNPLVGAVIVKDEIILGEGYHRKFGSTHAEVNALASVPMAQKAHLRDAKMYVTLEPCNHQGKTPPCTLAIQRSGIRELEIAAPDPSNKIGGKGIKDLQDMGIVAMLPNFFSLEELPHQAFAIVEKYKRPKIILKFAQSADGFIGKKNQQVWLTNPWSKRLVHQWRSRVGAIMVGTNTILTDDPLLTTRYDYGESPLRVLPDFKNRLNPGLKVFSKEGPIWILSHHQNNPDFPINYVTRKLVPRGQNPLEYLNTELIKAGISTLFVEGGKALLESFISAGLWDEIRVFTSRKNLIEGISSPDIRGSRKIKNFHILNDRLDIYVPDHKG